MRVTVAGEPVELRARLTLECLPGEPILLSPQVDSVELRAGPAGSTPSWADGAVTVHAIGRHTFRVTVRGVRMDLTLVCCEPELLPFLAAQYRQLGHGGDIRSTARVRRVMRSLAQHPAFTGRVADVTGYHAELVPSVHGA